MPSSHKAKIKKHIGDFESRHVHHLNEFATKADKLRNICAEIERARHGSFADAEQVKKEIDELMGEGFSIDSFKAKTSEVRFALKELHREVDLLISYISTPHPSAASDHLSDLRKMELGQPKAHFISKRLSKEGAAHCAATHVPPWIYFEGVSLEASKTAEWFDEFRDTIMRFSQALEKH